MKISRQASLYRQHGAVGVVIVLAWAILAVIDIPAKPWSGYVADSSNVVVRVEPGSPADIAGLKAGDVIRRMDGTALQDSKSVAKLGRASIGESRTLEIDRDREIFDLALTFAAMPVHEQRVALARSLLGFGFFFCFWPLLTRPDRSALILAIMGAGLGLALTGMPYLESSWLRSAGNIFHSGMVLAGIVALLQFLLVFPDTAPFLRGRPQRWRWLNLPAVLLWLLLVFRQLASPSATNFLNVSTNMLAGLVVGAYLLFSLITLLRKFIRASEKERSAKKLRLLFWGAMAGVVPVLVGSVIQAVSANHENPGADFLFLSLVLIPVSWTLAVLKGKT